MSDRARTWKRLVLHAEGNHGVIDRKIASALGVTEDALRRHARAGRLVKAHPTVFTLAGHPAGFTQSVAAACEWAGVDAYASGRTAARLYGLDGFTRESVIELVTTSQRRIRGGKVLVHRTDRLPPHHRALVDGIRVTSIERTLLDLGGLVREERVEIAGDCALRRGLTRVERLRATVDEMGGRGRRGTATLRKILDARGDWRHTDSSLETKMLRLLRRGNLPDPIIQSHQGSSDRHIGRVDLLYRDPPLIIEVDSYRYHSSRAAWQNDLSRQNQLVADGRRILRFTEMDIEQRPDEILRLIHSIFGRKAADSAGN